jgi:serine protease DegQ
MSTFTSSSARGFRFRGIGLLTLAACLAMQAPAIAQTTTPSNTAQSTASPTPLPTLADILVDVLPAVVSISVVSEAPATSNPLFNDPTFRQFFEDQQPQQQQQPQEQQLSAGSGVIVDAEQGYVITNHHVIEGGQQVSVTLSDGRILTAEVVGSDQATDIAVLKIPAENLHQIEIRSSSELRVGDYVIAIGNPFGLEQTVTSGIVSALGRSGLNIEGYEDFIQTDASINPGNSGGALVTLDGRLVGINTAILAPSGGNVGIGFSVPTTIVTAVMDQIIENGEVQRGQLGVQIQDLTPDLAQALGIPTAGGAVVASVEPGSAAEAAGLVAGDVITRVDEQAVTSSTSLRNIIGLTRIGTEVSLHIWREGQESDVTATIAAASTTTAGNTEQPSDQALDRLAGATFRDFQSGDSQLAESGAVVSQVTQGSAAAAAGLVAGDIIVRVNQQPITTVAELTSAVAAAEGTIALQVLRGPVSFLLVIR